MVNLNDAGMIVYDVPTQVQQFGAYLRRQLRAGGALPVNLSVYMVNWADVPRFERIIAEAKEKYAEELSAVDTTGGLQHVGDKTLYGRLRCHILKFDDSNADRVRDMAVEGLSYLIADIHASIDRRLEKMRNRAEAELPRRIQIELIRKIEEVEAHAVAFRLMESVEEALEAARSAVVAQIGADVATKYMGALLEGQES
jgi:hypothetical protein